MRGHYLCSLAFICSWANKSANVLLALYILLTHLKEMDLCIHPYAFLHHAQAEFSTDRNPIHHPGQWILGNLHTKVNSPIRPENQIIVTCHHIIMLQNFVNSKPLNSEKICGDKNISLHHIIKLACVISAIYYICSKLYQHFSLVCVTV